MRLRISSKLSWALLTTLSLSGITWAYAPVESRSGAEWSGSKQTTVRETDPKLAQMQKMEFLQQEVQELRGKVEELTYQLQQMQEQQKKLYLDLEKRLGEKSTSSKSSSDDAGISFDDLENHSSASQTKQAVAANANEEQAYRQAYRLVQNRETNKALLAFQKFVKDYPQGKYLPNVHYWMGEIHLNQGDLDLAADSFTVVYQQFAHHPKAADALLKLGYVEQARGKLSRSKSLLTQVKDQFPGSTSAQLADARLQKLKQEGQI
jgi:tol-pal system protein YbgF